jgi:hypothetical protein
MEGYEIGDIDKRENLVGTLNAILKAFKEDEPTKRKGRIDAFERDDSQLNIAAKIIQAFLAEANSPSKTAPTDVLAGIKERNDALVMNLEAK